MIDIVTKVHDKYSIELKVSFLTRRKSKMNDFSVAMWCFVPGSLDINRSTYPKGQFYQDVKSNIRLITPAFLLREIAGGSAVPLENLRKACTEIASHPARSLVPEYEYQVKMFVAIVKSALRDEFLHILKNKIDSDCESLCREFIGHAGRIFHAYGKLRSVINVSAVPEEVMKMYLFGDEFLCDIVSRYLTGLIDWMDSGKMLRLRGLAAGLYGEIAAHKREMGYPVIRRDDPQHNRIYLHRFSVLKKYIESDLYLRAPKKRDGVLVEQLYFSIAAGFAMLFATVVSFAFQRKFGSLTFPLFIALIISYMLKDRIKELMRYYFAHRVGSKYFDNKAKIIHKDTELGWLKEGVDFISSDKVPGQVMAIRNSSHLVEVENNITNEKIILYRKSVHVDGEKLQAKSDYAFDGINDIIRLNVNSFIKKMDNPQALIKVLDETGCLETVTCDRDYFLNLVLQYQYDRNIEYKRFRIAFSRDGIHSIEKVE